MKKQDRVAASVALIAWLDSQKINPPDSVEVLIVTISAMVLQIAKSNDANPWDGADIVHRLIDGTMREMEE